MEQYVAFLRAINVSGHRLIKMEDLRRILGEMPGVANVRTYIQSGNVLLEAKEKDEAKLTAKIEKQLVKELGFEVEVFLRTKAELEEILSNNPFKKAALGKDLALYITFLTKAPDAEQRKTFESQSNEIDSFKIAGRDVYALVVKDGSKSLFSNMFVERKLKQLATGRNQTTLHKILAMFDK
ncbi:DUF1697 domain-containing protein [Polluticoccus soli]|uniref:DUF1697 domain-containing protein n=1 Tax=Polluticoccus soli TaxID=3034150 RepID=UPI0023E1AA67|nr:DUF1697 domain-containing protein [Flavipsychrobacter sp. JY13-12]